MMGISKSACPSPRPGFPAHHMLSAASRLEHNHVSVHPHPPCLQHPTWADPAPSTLKADAELDHFHLSRCHHPGVLPELSNHSPPLLPLAPSPSLSGVHGPAQLLPPQPPCYPLTSTSAPHSSTGVSSPFLEHSKLIPHSQDCTCCSLSLNSPPPRSAWLTPSPVWSLA